MVKLISDSNKRPGCQLFEGDLCLDPEDEAVVSHLIHEEDLKRNVIRNRKKLWPQKTVYYSVDRNLSELFWKFVRYVGRKVIFFGGIGQFSCGISVILIMKCGIAVFSK